MGGRAAKQRDCTLVVAPLDVSDPHRELCQALPKCLLVDLAVLPSGLEHLVSVECEATIQQILGICEGLRRRQHQVIRNAWNPCTARRKWPAQSVARSGALGPARFVPVTLGHLSIMTTDWAQSAIPPNTARQEYVRGASKLSEIDPTAIQFRAKIEYPLAGSMMRG